MGGGSLQQHRGGIIADVMGLGKTLIVLAAILKSLLSAQFPVFNSSGIPHPFQGKPLTRATLVVVPSIRKLLHSDYSLGNTPLIEERIDRQLDGSDRRVSNHLIHQTFVSDNIFSDISQERSTRTYSM